MIVCSVLKNNANKLDKILCCINKSSHLLQHNNKRFCSIVPQVSKNNESEKLIRKYEDKIIFNSIIEKQKPHMGFRRNKAHEEKEINQHKKRLMQLYSREPLPVTLKYFNNEKTDLQVKKQDVENDVKENKNISIQFPFNTSDKVELTSNIKGEFNKSDEELNLAKNEVKYRNTHYDEYKLNWLTDYENYDDEISENDIDSWKLNYGTPDPNSTISNIPCGGCGALLHCKDTGIPGYIPSEIFNTHSFREGQDLRALTCQRCHFLKEYNMALQVRVSPEDYPKILETINENQKALVILMVDLLDFPCSIWPDIIKIIGNKRPVIIVGNKVDLLAKDCRNYLNNIKRVLAESISDFGLTKANIVHIALISAKTGYGIENLITKLHNVWKYKGDVYLVGCTNVGKSTLFNALLQSDYCKIKAVDLVQRATTSLWPGTTLNLLKFPILRPSAWRLYVRTQRLKSLNKLQAQEMKFRNDKLRKTQNPVYATLIGNIERTFSAEEPINENTIDMFSVQGQANASGRMKVGINENRPEYKLSKWCYDTPGVVQSDQILHLLTTEEIMLTLPRQIISPRTFSIKAGYTIFLAGLARLDLLEAPLSVRFTIFASDKLPITICPTSDADEIYNELLGSELFQVPKGPEDRLKQWPKLLSSEEIKLTGIDKETSVADIVLSSAGWISVTPGSNLNCVLKAWTPEKRGIYVRDSMLSKAVQLRGKKIRGSPAYRRSKFL